MNKLPFVCVLAGISGFIFDVSAGDIRDKLQLLAPDGVSLGMRQEELQVIRPKAKLPALPLLGVMRMFREKHGLSQSENVVTNLPLSILYEANLEMPSLTHEYHFVDGWLRAINGSVSYLTGEKDKEDARKVLGRLSAHMSQESDIEIVAADGEFQLQRIKFSQWRDSKAGKVLLFFDADENVFPGGTQVILFDEKYFGVKDFFLVPEDLPKITTLYSQLRKSNAEHNSRVQELRQTTERRKESSE